ncbi:MAG TPA: lactate utilization protein, partial [Beijerinckiaceae bacterium]
TLRMGEDPRLAAMPWGETALEVSRGPSQGGDLNAVSHAFGAVAESGTAVMVSGPENPSTLNFLPDNHIVVVAAKDIAGDYEQVLAKVRARYGKGRMPRTVNFITGPSRSGDIEQTLLLGAHGPRRLHIVVVKG